jgi:hypothetical protein
MPTPMPPPAGDGESESYGHDPDTVAGRDSVQERVVRDPHTQCHNRNDITTLDDCWNRMLAQITLIFQLLCIESLVIRTHILLARARCEPIFHHELGSFIQHANKHHLNHTNTPNLQHTDTNIRTTPPQNMSQAANRGGPCSGGRWTNAGGAVP